MNKFRIISNSKLRNISYYFKNERQEWVPVSRFSTFAKRSFTSTTIEESAEKIVDEILSSYCLNGNNLEIHFIGNDDDFELLNKAINSKGCPKITAVKEAMSVLVLGNVASGKTTLSEALMEFRNADFAKEKVNGLDILRDQENNSLLAELSVDKLLQEKDKMLGTLKEMYLSKILYCINSEGGRVDPSEIEIIKSLQKTFTNVGFVLVLTMAVTPEKVEEIRNEAMSSCDQIATFALLAEDYKYKEGTILESFGIEELSEYVFKR